MPIYEYRCDDCRKKFEVLVLRVEEESSLRCPHCSSAKMKRLISRFTSIKSEEARLESLTDPSNLSGLDENDPASMARWLKRMGGELGEDVSKDEIDQMADEIASGKALDEGPGGGGGLDGGDLGSDPSDDMF
jgi:putative FmdB family regulatory protein